MATPVAFQVPKKVEIIQYDFWTGAQNKIDWWTTQTMLVLTLGLIVENLMFLKEAYFPSKLRVSSNNLF